MKLPHFLKIFTIVIFACFVGFPLGLFLSFTVLGLFVKGAYTPYIVLSGSMEPAVKTGSIAFSRPSISYDKGDIITFSQNGNKKELVTHRLVEIKSVNGATVYMTKGDANNDIDNWEVTTDEILGKSDFSIPYIGYVVDFAKKPQGFISFVIIPATIVVYEELKNLKNELFTGFRGLFKKIKSKKQNVQDTSIQSAGVAALPSKSAFPLYYLAILIPLFGVAFVVAFSFSHSFFSDLEKNSGNTLGASVTFELPSPTPTQAPTEVP